MMCDLKELFKRFEGQPIEVICESGFKYCGIDVYSNDESVTIIDSEGRLVHIEFKHIESVIEPQKKLNRLCKDNDCDCHSRSHSSWETMTVTAADAE